MTEALVGYENTTLEGVGTFGRLLSGSPQTAVYELEGDANSPATLIEVMPGDTPEAESRLARWQERAQLSHPNLLRLYQAGSVTLQGAPLIFAVMERPEESLEEVLSTRPLLADEVSEILQPALSALAYLHRNGYAQGRLQPSKVLAVGNTVKLSTEDVLPIGDGGNPASDMWAFGAVLVQAMTGSAPEPGTGLQPAHLPQLAAEPLTQIVRHCLDVNAQTRWTAEQALSCLEGTATPGDTGSVDHLTPEPAAEPAAPVRPKWIPAAVIALSLLVVAGIVWQAGGSSHPAAVSPAVAQTPEVIPADSRRHRAAEPVSHAAPQPVAPSAVQEKAAPALLKNNGGPGSWTVVVASYRARGPAEKRVREASKKWTKFKVELIDAPSEKAPLLVVIGKNLSGTAAKALRERARHAGLPRDTYIKRLDTQGR